VVFGVMEATSPPLHQQFHSRRHQCLRIQNNAGVVDLGNDPNHL